MLPGGFPNLLANGAAGIAVGMATNVPPHNAAEIADAALHLIRHPNASLATILEKIPGPDFPTGAIILNSKTEIRKAYEVGSGAVKIRGEWKLEDLPRGKQQIIITSIPYGVNKSKQHLFKIVRIEIVDIGIGKPFGPINALVIDDDNTSTIPPKKITVTEYNE